MKPLFLFSFIFTLIFFSCKNTGSTVEKKSLSEDFSQQITEKYWKLKVLNKKKIKMEKHQEREVYFILKTERNKVKGFAGCNHFSGFYDLKNKQQKIKFTNFSTAKKTCDQLKFDENDFLDVLEKTAKFELKKDQLSLKDNKNKILAEFEAIYF